MVLALEGPGALLALDWVNNRCPPNEERRFDVSDIHVPLRLFCYFRIYAAADPPNIRSLDIHA